MCPEDSPKKSQKDYVTQEIIETEKLYVRNLRLFSDFIDQFSKKEGDLSDFEKKFSKAEQGNIKKLIVFNENIKKIIALSDVFITKLTPENLDESSVSDAFENLFDSLKKENPYLECISEADAVSNALEGLRKNTFFIEQERTFKTKHSTIPISSESTNNSHTQSLNLLSFVISPLQRTIKYQSLLEALEKALPKESQESQALINIKKRKQEAQSLCKTINLAKQSKEMQAHNEKKILAIFPIKSIKTNLPLFP